MWRGRAVRTYTVTVVYDWVVTAESAEEAAERYSSGDVEGTEVVEVYEWSD